MLKIISRPELNKVPGLPLPIHIRSTGYNEAPSGWSENEPSPDKNFVQLFWSVQGTGDFLLPDGRIIRLNCGDVVYRLPGERHRHRSVDPVVPWHYYWFTFDGPGAREFMLSYGYPQAALHGGDCPVKLFRELEVLLKTRTLYAQRHAVSLATEILALAGNAAAPVEHDLVRRFLELTGQRLGDPELRIDDIADELGIHRTTLGRVVLQQMSISPKRYLNELRIQRALSMLTESTLPIKALAYAVGINKTDYLCMLIKKSTGFTPSVYRRLLLAETSGSAQKQ